MYDYREHRKYLESIHIPGKRRHPWSTRMCVMCCTPWPCVVLALSDHDEHSWQISNLLAEIIWKEEGDDAEHEMRFFETREELADAILADHHQDGERCASCTEPYPCDIARAALRMKE